MRVSVYPVEIFVQFSAFYNERAAAILSLPLITVALVLDDPSKTAHEGPGLRKSGRRRLGSRQLCAGSGKSPASSSVPWSLGLSIGVPVAHAAQGGRGVGPTTSECSRPRSSRSSSVFPLPPRPRPLTVLLALLLSYLIVRSTGWQSTALSIAVFIPFVVPPTSLGVGLIEVWNRPLVDMVYSSPLIIVMGYLSRYLPFAVVTIHSGLKQIDQRSGGGGEPGCWSSGPG